MGAQGGEAVGLDAVAAPQDPRHRGGQVVIADAGGHAAEALERRDVALEERLLVLAQEGHVTAPPDATGAGGTGGRRAARRRSTVASPKSTSASSPGSWRPHDRHAAVPVCQLARGRRRTSGARSPRRPRRRAPRRGAPRPAGRCGAACGAPPGPRAARRGSGGIRAQSPAPPARRAARRWHRRGQRLAHGAPVDAVAASQGPDRQPFLPMVQPDTLEQLHPRQLLCPRCGGLARPPSVGSDGVGGGASC